ncbi:MAG TPA: hypothetical protein VIL97_01830 [Thermoanaerobaculia bacterium]
MTPIPLSEVTAIRERFARGRELTAARFRDAFAASDAPPNERWRSHLEIQAASMLDALEYVSLPGALKVHYEIDGRVIRPFVKPNTPLYPFFAIEKTPPALLEYWIFVSELSSSGAWSMTRLVATSEEYNDALARMQQPQLVRSLVAAFLPAGEFRDDGNAMLDVTLYTCAGEERVERRRLLLDENQEFHFHSRELIAEGRGGALSSEL